MRARHRPQADEGEAPRPQGASNGYRAGCTNRHAVEQCVRAGYSSLPLVPQLGQYPLSAILISFPPSMETRYLCHTLGWH